MRECFGYGRIVRLEAPEGSCPWGAEFLGCKAGPVNLLPSLAGMPVPDLTDYEGQVLQLAGSLDAPADGGTLRTAGLRLSDILELPDPSAGVHFLHCAVSGNLGKAPEEGQSSDRITASLAFLSGPRDSAWLSLVAYLEWSISDVLKSMESGAWVQAFGTLETFVYKGKPKVQLALLGIDLIGRREGRPKPQSLMSSRPAASDDAADSFVNAA